MLQECLKGGIKLGAVHALEGGPENALRSPFSGIVREERDAGRERRMTAGIGGIRADRQCEQVAHAGISRVWAQRRNRFGGEALHPGVGIFEGGAQLRGRGIGAFAESFEGLARAVAGIRVGAGEHLQQHGQVIALALAQYGGGAFADKGRPTRESGQELLVAALFVVVGIAFESKIAACGDDSCDLCFVERWDGEGLLAGEAQTPEWKGIGDEMLAAAVPANVFVVLLGSFGRGLIHKGTVPAPGEVIIPSLLFQIGTNGLRAAAGDALQRPEVVEVIAGVAALALAVGGGGHFGKEPGRLAVSQQIKKDRSGRALPVVLVSGVGPMIAVWDAALVDPPAEEAGRLRNGPVEIRMRHPGLSCEDHADGEAQARLVHRPVAAEIATRQSKPVPPGAHAALTARRLQRETLQARQDRGVTRGRDIFPEKDHEVAVVP